MNSSKREWTLTILLILMFALVCSTAIAATVHPALTIRETFESYPVFASSRDELLEQLWIPSTNVEQAQRHARGLTRTTLDMDRRVSRNHGACEVAEIQIELHVHTVLPTWANGEPVPEALREEWDRLRGVIAEHEGLHRQNALEAANRLKAAVAGVANPQGCRSLSSQMARILGSVQVQRDLQDGLIDARAAQASLGAGKHHIEVRRARPAWMESDPIGTLRHQRRAKPEYSRPMGQGND